LKKELYNLADKLKYLREQQGLTQSELSRILGLTRSSVNGWEMGLAVPSTPIIIELAKLYHVTTDYLLGLEGGIVIPANRLSEREVAVISSLIECMQERNA